jgi:methionyl-tRNA formyltransferase
MNNYIVATVKEWNVEAFNAFTENADGNWHLITHPDELTVDRITEIQPRYIFFPHWSWKIAEELRDLSECIIFHMTDLPYGRGGSPLQNLIQRGHTETAISAIRAEAKMDSGAVYLKRPLSLSGNAQLIFEQAAKVVFAMVAEIAQTEPVAIAQEGEPVTFQRRTPAQSILPEASNALELYNHIRMLDADSYPRAFIENASYRLEFSDAEFEDGEVLAKVRFRKREGT